MNEALLQTKLHIPTLRSSYVPRPRLIARLNAGLDGKLTLISAPAGYGKTTLVTEWLADLRLPIADFRLNGSDRQGKESAFTAVSGDGEDDIGTRRRAAWLSLDEADNDPSRFLAYLIAAVQQIQPGLGESVGILLRSPQLPPAELILTALVNELAAVPEPFTLVLDDYHVIHSLPIHQEITFLLEHQPSRMHLVIMTREDPLLPIARLRARGQVMEIRQEDLCFTNQETADFLGRVMGLDLSLQNVAVLEQRTEGWIAGLQLAALSIRGIDDPKEFIRDFTGSNRYVLDYLIEEVFKRQSSQVKDFLLKTSILERLCEPLCDAVVGNPSPEATPGQGDPATPEALTPPSGSQAILEYLDHSNLFIIPLDRSRIWYRYHHLFSELLQLRLRASAAYDESNLHQRASRWYESQGLLQEAVEHSLAAGDWGNAARQIGMASATMLPQGEFVRLLNWFRRLPQQVVQSNGQLCLVHAWAAMMAGQFDSAVPLLERAQELAEAGSHFLGQVRSAQAFLARSKRDNNTTIEKSEQALSLLPETDIVTRGIIVMNLGLAYWHEGYVVQAEEALTQARDLCDRSGNNFALQTAEIFLARIPAVRGKLKQAAVLCGGLIEAAGQAPVHSHPYYDMAAIQLEWGDPGKAQEYFDKGFALAQRGGNAEFRQAGALLQAILFHARGNDEDAILALTEADEMARDFPDVIRSRTAAFGVQMALRRNDPQMLAHWEPQVKAEVDAHSFYRFMGLTQARLLIARGQKEQAAEALKAILEKASHSGWGYGMLVVRILQSLAAKGIDEAMPFISEALRLGKAENFVHSFVDAGPGLVPILQEAVRRRIEPEYAGGLLSALGAGRNGEVRTQAGLVEALSEREIEVLRLVTLGLSNREIAGKLFISPGTAKTHIHNLCGKLGVRNRTEAAMKAKELGFA